MSPWVAFYIFTLLIFGIYGNEPLSDSDPNNDIATEGTNTDVNRTLTSDKNTAKLPTRTSTPSAMIIKPTPTDPSKPSETTTSPQEESNTATYPSSVALPPPATTIVPQEKQQFCGKKGYCYQWFDDQWAIELSGYKRCGHSDERRAKRYCCLPPQMGRWDSHS